MPRFVARRQERGPLDLDIPERKILLRPDGTVDRVAVPERLDAHRLIEEFMILANVAAAETLEAKRTPLVYRVHDEPSMEKVVALREFLRTLDIGLSKQGALRAAHSTPSSTGSPAPTTPISSTRWCCGRRARPNMHRRTSGISA